VSLQTVLAEIEPSWFAAAGEGAIDPALLRRARGSALGERILARWLAADHGAAVLAPNPEREIGAVAVRWPRARLQPLLRDLGVLAMAPAIRAEVGRDAVRRLKQALGNSYLLALDRTVWDGRVPAEAALRMSAELSDALNADAGGAMQAYDRLYALLERRGRIELHAWSLENDRAIGEWARLLHPREPDDMAVLPPEQVQMLHEHHLARGRSAPERAVA
jgi:hypothetical protein